MSFEFKYNEDANLQEAMDYIRSTYGEHYTNDNTNIQVFDVWNANGTLSTTARDTAQKYLARFGKKAGHNRRDLLKAIHYIILMMYVEDTK